MTSPTISGILPEPVHLLSEHYVGDVDTSGRGLRPLVTMRRSTSPIDLDGDGRNEAAALLYVETEQLESAQYLVVLKVLNRVVQNVATVRLADGAATLELRADERGIVHETYERGAHDPECCRTTAWQRTWTFDNGVLTETASRPLDYAATLANTSLGPMRRVRGRLRREAGKLVLAECSSGRVASVGGSPDSELPGLFDQLAVDDESGMFVEVIGQWSNRRLAIAGQDPEHAVFVESTRRAEREGLGCDETMDGFRYRVRGNEPFWNLDVHDDHVDYRAMSSEPIRFDATAYRTTADTVFVSAGSDNRSVEARITAARCVDSMSGSLYAYSATLKIGDREFEGCAIDGF